MGARIFPRMPPDEHPKATCCARSAPGCCMPHVAHPRGPEVVARPMARRHVSHASPRSTRRDGSANQRQPCISPALEDAHRANSAPPCVLSINGELEATAPPIHACHTALPRRPRPRRVPMPRGYGPQARQPGSAKATAPPTLTTPALTNARSCPRLPVLPALQC